MRFSNLRHCASVSRIALIAACAAIPGAAIAQEANPQAPIQLASLEDDGRDVVAVYADRLRDEPGSVSIIDREQIESARADHPAEILNTQPGVNIHINSGQELLVAIRSPVLTGGAGQGSFLFLENGVPIRAPAHGNVNALFEVHHEIADAIEVVRGPGSARYGSNAVHGLINIIAPEPDPARGTQLTLSANSLARYRADLETHFSEAGVDYFSALSLVDDTGWRSQSGVDMQKLTFRSSWQGATWNVVSSLSGFNLNQETAGFIQGVDAYEDEDLAKTNPNPEAYRDAWAARANVRFERALSDTSTLTFTPFAITQRMLFAQHFLPNGGTEKNGHDSLGVLGRYDFGPDNFRVSIGGDAQWSTGFLTEIQDQPFGFFPGDSRFPVGVHYDYDVDTWTFAAFAEAAWQFAPDWSLLAGARAETHTYDYVTNVPSGVNGRFNVPPSREDDFQLFTPKVGVVYSGLDNVELYANYARGERAPQASDQYRLQSLQTYEPLEVETLDSFEIGFRGDHGWFAYDVAAYMAEKDNFFFRDADGLNVPNGKTDHTGIEAGFSGDYDSGLFWNASLSWSDQTYAFNRDVGNASEDIVDGAKIDTAPEWLADFGLGWRNERFSVYGWGEHVGEYYTNAANTAMYDGHTVFNLRGAWEVNDTFETFLIVRNLTDERYADRADFAFGNHRFFPGEPLNATIGVRIKR